MTLRLTWPATKPELQLTTTQVASFAKLAGHQLVIGPAGSGRSTSTVHAAIAAANEFGVDKVWVIASSRSSAEQLKAKIISVNPALTPRVFTVSAIAFAMLRTELLIQTSGEVNLTMLTGPAQESRIRDLINSKRIDWPKRWQHAIGTRVFASDIRRFLDIALSNGESHPDNNVDKALSEFSATLMQEAKLNHETNYIEANLAAAELLKSDSMQSRTRFSPDALIIDDIHDFDSSQLQLVTAILEQVKFSLATSNADATVLGFRGVGIETTKKYRDAVNPKVHLLEHIFRYGEKIGSIVRDFLPTLVAPDLNEKEVAALRQAKFVKPDKGSVIFEVSASSSIRDSLIVNKIMQARINEKISFSEIAIIGRSFSSLSELRRTLAEAAIPVEFAPDNVALARDPAASQLVNTLALVIEPLEGADSLQLLQFAQSEIVGMTSAQLRHTAQFLRKEGLFGSTAEVISMVLRQPYLLASLPFDPILQPIRRAAAILHSLSMISDSTTSLAELLWWLWQAKVISEIAQKIGYDQDENWQNWPTRLTQQSKLASAVGRRADRDLDAVLALFDAADRFDRNKKSNSTLADFVYELAQQDAASEVLIQRAATGVAVLTAHRARGREWKLVFLIDLQEGIWPAGNVRESIIAPRDSTGQRIRLAEERRLAAAAATTASETLVIAVIDSKIDQGVAPSSLLLSYELPELISEAPPTLLTARGLIAQLRSIAIDPNVSNALREAAINRLGHLAKSSDLRFKPAQPEQWWFVSELTTSDSPISDNLNNLKISGSMLDSITRCPTQWFFERKLGIADKPVANTVIGIAIHSIAQKIVSENLPADQALAELSKIWPSDVFDATWQSKVQFSEAEKMVNALHAWIEKNKSEVLGAEISFDVLYADLGVTLIGTIDLLQQTPEGDLEVVDFKTGSTKPTKADLAEHPQLGIYQLALSGSETLNPVQRKVQAKLVQIRTRNAKEQAVEQQAPELVDPKWLIEDIDNAKTRIINEDLPARPGTHCRNCKVRFICPAVPEGDQVTG